VLYLGDDEAVKAVSARLGVGLGLSGQPVLGRSRGDVRDPDGFRVVLVPERWTG
jgi:hypothetical protein